MIVLLLYSQQKKQPFGCTNYDGKTVDWWIMVKPNPDNKAVYLDDSLEEMSYVPDFDEYTNPLMKTIVPLYENTTRIMSLMWNDELDGVEFDTIYGSQKGVLAIDPKTKTGFILQHSTPNWPPPVGDDQQEFWDNPDYGQHYLCISINMSQVENYAQSLLATYPQVYQNSFTIDFVKDAAPSLVELFGIESELARVNVPIYTPKGRQFSVISRQGYVNNLWDAVKMKTHQDGFAIGWSLYGEKMGRAHVLPVPYNPSAPARFKDADTEYLIKAERINLLRSRTEMEERVENGENITQAELDEFERMRLDYVKRHDENEARLKLIRDEQIKNEKQLEENEPMFHLDDHNETVITDKWADILYHANWEITKDGSMICFADINHQKSKQHQSAAAICLQDQSIVKKIIAYCQKTQEHGYQQEYMQAAAIDQNDKTKIIYEHKQEI